MKKFFSGRMPEVEPQPPFWSVVEGHIDTLVNTPIDQIEDPLYRHEMAQVDRSLKFLFQSSDEAVEFDLFAKAFNFHYQWGVNVIKTLRLQKEDDFRELHARQPAINEINISAKDIVEAYLTQIDDNGNPIMEPPVGQILTANRRFGYMRDKQAREAAKTAFDATSVQLQLLPSEETSPAA